MSEEVKQHNKNHNLFVGVVLIAVGIFFLLSNMFDIYLDNWWALFILIPAFFAFSDAYKLYEKNDRQMSRQIRGRIIGGIIPLTVALIFLLQLDWGSVWPVFIIIVGVGMLLG